MEHYDDLFMPLTGYIDDMREVYPDTGDINEIFDDIEDRLLRLKNRLGARISELESALKQAQSTIEDLNYECMGDDV